MIALIMIMKLIKMDLLQYSFPSCHEVIVLVLFLDLFVFTPLVFSQDISKRWR